MSDFPFFPGRGGSAKARALAHVEQARRKEILILAGDLGIAENDPMWFVVVLLADGMAVARDGLYVSKLTNSFANWARIALQRVEEILSEPEKLGAQIAKVTVATYAESFTAEATSKLASRLAGEIEERLKTVSQRQDTLEADLKKILKRRHLLARMGASLATAAFLWLSEAVGVALGHQGWSPELLVQALHAAPGDEVALAGGGLSAVLVGIVMCWLISGGVED